MYPYMNVFLDDQCILQEGHLLASSKLWHITGNVTSTTPDPSSMHAPINLTVSAIGGHKPNAGDHLVAFAHATTLSYSALSTLAGKGPCQWFPCQGLTLTTLRKHPRIPFPQSKATLTKPDKTNSPLNHWHSSSCRTHHLPMPR